MLIVHYIALVPCKVLLHISSLSLPLNVYMSSFTDAHRQQHLWLHRLLKDTGMYLHSQSKFFQSTYGNKIYGGNIH